MLFKECLLITWQQFSIFVGSFFFSAYSHSKRWKWRIFEYSVDEQLEKPRAWQEVLLSRLSSDRNWLCILTESFDFFVDITMSLILLLPGDYLILSASALLYKGVFCGAYLVLSLRVLRFRSAFESNPHSQWDELCVLGESSWTETFYSCGEITCSLYWGSLKLNYLS